MGVTAVSSSSVRYVGMPTRSMDHGLRRIPFDAEKKNLLLVKSQKKASPSFNTFGDFDIERQTNKPNNKTNEQL